MTITDGDRIMRTYMCNDCGFASSDIHLMANHSCEVQAHGGRCEDFPCCGHEPGDCNGLLYGSDEAIKADPHLLCNHENGDCEVDYDDEEPDDDDTYDEVAFFGSAY